MRLKKGHHLEVSEALRGQLVEDGGQHVGNGFVFGVARHGERVGRQRRLHFRVVEVDDRAIVLITTKANNESIPYRHRWRDARLKRPALFDRCNL